MNLRERIKKWWDGETTVWAPEANAFGLFTERHWTSDKAHAVWDFYKAHWQWIIGTILAIIGIIIAI